MPPVRAASFLICGNTVTEDVGINPIIITNANSTLKNCFETLFFISLSSFSGIDNAIQVFSQSPVVWHPGG